MHERIETEVKIFDIKLDVTGTYYPPEPMVHHDDNMEGYPGAPAEFELESVQLEGIEITTLIDGDVIDLIVEQVIEKQS